MFYRSHDVSDEEYAEARREERLRDEARKEAERVIRKKYNTMSDYELKQVIELCQSIIEYREEKRKEEKEKENKKPVKKVSIKDYFYNFDDE